MTEQIQTPGVAADQPYLSEQHRLCGQKTLQSLSRVVDGTRYVTIWCKEKGQ